VIAAPEISAGAIADILGGAVEGDATRIVRRVAALDQAEEDALSWLGSDKYLALLASTRAGAVIVPRATASLPGKTLIRVDDPDLALTVALQVLGPPIPQVAPGVDPRAVIDPSATTTGAAIAAGVFVGPRAVIAPGTQLHPGVYIGADTHIGRDCILWPNVVVRERCTLGDRVIIHPNATIGADGFGYLPRGGRHHKIPQVGIVAIEDDVEIGAGTTIDRAKSGVTRIGRGTKIDNLVQVGHNCDIGEDCIIVAQVGVSGSTTLGRNVVLAGQVGVADHVKVGDRVVVTAQSGVYQNVEPGTALGGAPAVEQRQYLRQSIALRRLPEMVGQLRELIRRIEKLESAAHDKAGG
jgi:UDP-3-O-[3-hydroxymyristoyl] glucosamine N-acyltransferase